MKCSNCGNEMINPIGGNFYCLHCGMAINDLVYRTQDYNAPVPKDTTKQEGWICPACGRGVAPWVDVCPCQGANMQTTYVTSTGINGFADVDEYMKWVKEYQDKITEELK